MDLKGRTLRLKVEDSIYLVLPAKDDYDYNVNIAIVELNPTLLESMRLGLAAVEQLNGDKNFELLKYSTEAVNFYEVDLQKEIEFWACFVTEENSEFDGRFEMNKKEWRKFNKEYLTVKIFPKYWTLSIKNTITLSGDVEIPVLHKTIQFCTHEVSTEQLFNLLRRQQ